MNAKKCDRCGSFYVRKELKMDNTVGILDKNVFNVVFKYRGDGYDYDYLVDLCPKCMNEFKWFFENAKKQAEPHIAKVEEDTKTEDPCHDCANPHCEQCTYGYKSLEERIRLAKENKE